MREEVRNILFDYIPLEEFDLEPAKGSHRGGNINNRNRGRGSSDDLYVL